MTPLPNFIELCCSIKDLNLNFCAFDAETVNGEVLPADYFSYLFCLNWLSNALSIKTVNVMPRPKPKEGQTNFFNIYLLLC